MRAFGISFAFMATLTLAVVACQPVPANSGGRAVAGEINLQYVEQACFSNGVCCYNVGHVWANLSCVATKITIEPGEMSDVRPQSNDLSHELQSLPVQGEGEMGLVQGFSRFVQLPAARWHSTGDAR